MGVGFGTGHDCAGQLNRQRLHPHHYRRYRHRPDRRPVGHITVQHRTRRAAASLRQAWRRQRTQTGIPNWNCDFRGKFIARRHIAGRWHAAHRSRVAGHRWRDDHAEHPVHGVRHVPWQVSRCGFRSLGRGNEFSRRSRTVARRRAYRDLGVAMDFPGEPSARHHHFCGNHSFGAKDRWPYLEHHFLNRFFYHSIPKH